MKAPTNIIIATTMAGEAVSTLYDLRWMIVFIFVLIASDFWFGVSEARMKKQTFRLSRAGRRTCNKLVDYITYLILGAILGRAIFEPLHLASHTTTAAAGLSLACVWEIDSIINHILTIHGCARVPLLHIALKLLKKKHRDLGEAIEEGMNENYNMKNYSKGNNNLKQKNHEKH